jgi:hypothetical protein
MQERTLSKAVQIYFQISGVVKGSLKLKLKSHPTFGQIVDITRQTIHWWCKIKHAVNRTLAYSYHPQNFRWPILNEWTWNHASAVLLVSLMLKVDIPLKQPEGGQLWQSKPSNFRLSDIQMYLLPPHPQHFPAFSSVHLSLHPFKLCPICDICWMAASVLSKSCNPQRHPRWARGLGRTVSTTSMLGTKHHDDQPKPSCGW